MSRIRSKDTKPEVMLRHMLFMEGFRYRKHYKINGVNVDIAFPRKHKAINVHGCFWHQHQGCPRSKRPSTRKEFWNKKLDINIKRDKSNVKQLKEMGWRIAIVWECAIKMEPLFEKTMSSLEYWIQSEASEITIPSDFTRKIGGGSL